MYFECRICGKIANDGDLIYAVCLECMERQAEKKEQEEKEEQQGN